MKQKNGFTLIELLAVIVILAIVALIATPIVLNLINRARRGAAQDSAYGIRKAGQLYFQKLLLKDTENASEEIKVEFSNGSVTVTPAVEGMEFELGGTIPSDGEINISATGQVSGLVVINGYTCIIQNAGEVICGSGTGATSFKSTEIIYSGGSGDVTVQSAIEDLYTKLDY